MLALHFASHNSDKKESKLSHMYKKYYPDMFRAIYRIIPNEEISRDLVHDTMVKVLENNTVTQIENELSIRSYLVVSAKHAALDYTRVRENQPFANIDEVYAYLDKENTTDSLSELLITQERYNDVVQCIRNLPDTLKEACYYKFVCEMDDAQIAEKLNITYANAAMRIHRGRVLLRKKLAEVYKNEK